MVDAGRPVAVVTGAASGMGRATALRLARRGDHVVGLDVNQGGLEETVNQIKAAGGSAEGHVADVVRVDQIQGVCRDVAERTGRLDYLFSNAGVPFRRPVAEMPVEGWDRVIETHVTGTFICCQAVLPYMVARGKGAIVFTSSDFAVGGVSGAANYAAAKSALYALAKSLALEFAAAGVRVNAVGPGPIDTPFLGTGRSEQEWQATRESLARGVPMGRLGTPEEVAFVVEFLLSERASYITGQLVQPNGGQVMW